MHHLLMCVDAQTREQWQMRADIGQVHELESFLSFLQSRGLQCTNEAMTNCFTMLQSTSIAAQTAQQVNKAPQTSGAPIASQSAPLNIHAPAFKSQKHNKKCIVCGKPHIILSCPEFRRKPVADRRRLVTDKGLCMNCLRDSHETAKCDNEKRCRECNQNHHSLLHVATASTALNTSSVNHGPASLPTAQVQIMNYNELTRLVLDSGSQVNLISKELVNRMGDTAITKGTLPMIEHIQ
jgi:hypothetical protein